MYVPQLGPFGQIAFDPFCGKTMSMTTFFWFSTNDDGADRKWLVFRMPKNLWTSLWERRCLEIQIQI